MKQTRRVFSTLVVIVVFWIVASPAAAAPNFFGPTPYLSDADIPAGFYAGGSPAALENFEDGTLGFGITASAGGVALPGPLTDSVDADDGVIDGFGLAGHSWYFGPLAASGVTFTFSAPLPTAAGIVWTDGSGTVTFEAFGPGMVSLGTIGPVAIGDTEIGGQTAEDRFFGVQNAGGILAIKLSNTSGGIEVDHVQYGAAPSVSIPSSQVFSCGAGPFTEMKIGISDRGSVAQFNSPGLTSNEHIVRSGYQVCYRDTAGGAFSTSYDFGLVESGWSGGMTTSQPSGPGTFPLEITRTTADGKVRITRRFTANSFSASCPGGNCPSGYDSDGDGIACNILEDCGNCTNRTLHVLTRVTNLTGGNLFDVSVNELADFGISGESSSDRYVRTTDSVFAYKDASDGTGAGTHQGMLLQTLIDTGVTGVLDSGSYAAPADCSVGTLATPVAPGNYEAILSQPYGTLGAGANTGNTIRTHYRRF